MTIFIRKEQFSQNMDINSQLLGGETGIIHYRHVTNRVLGTKPDTVQFCPSVQVATHGEKRATTLEAHPSQHAPHYSLHCLCKSRAYQDDSRTIKRKYRHMLYNAYVLIQTLHGENCTSYQKGFGRFMTFYGSFYIIWPRAS